MEVSTRRGDEFAGIILVVEPVVVEALILHTAFEAFDGFVAQIGRRACYPFPQTDLAYWLSDGYAKSSVAVEDGDTDLDLCDLPIKVPRHQRLAE